ncbi:hypothetical protein CI238_08606 [Colletotrichum incanum]|uniref:Uncharacterized protein n=1 Tax=Colletotrichum incanum TaxID=1573173 RepID=A0A167EL35_COLIC|nr:hypothetical protein CI238_08606 [Colletotrichum incanum]
MKPSSKTTAFAFVMAIHNNRKRLSYLLPPSLSCSVYNSKSLRMPLGRPNDNSQLPLRWS